MIHDPAEPVILAPRSAGGERTGSAFPANLPWVVDELRSARQGWRSAHDRHAEHGIHFPSRQALKRIATELGIALFPLRLGPPELHAGNEDAYVGASLESTLSQLGAQILLELRIAEPQEGERALALRAEDIATRFAASLPDIRRLLDSDVEAGYRADPAARSADEVLLCYPSLTAVIHHRLAHRLHRLGAPLVARILSELAHRATGIDIHPGAEVGRSVFIDHGTGLVIGETAIIGDRVHLHQGVTLGGPAAAPGNRAPGRRHPSVGDDVVIMAGATIIGPVTIGPRSLVEGHVWLTDDVPADSIVRAPVPRIAARG